MKRFSEQLNKKAMTVKLRAAEKRELRERIVSYMEYHPLPKSVKSSAPKVTQTFSEEYRVVRIPFDLISKWAAAVTVLVMVLVPVLAERSVPGDGLYAVKRINEGIRGTLSFDTVQKVEWETELLNRRIAEARLLASEGRLTEEVEAEVVEAVRTHSENAQRNIDVLRTEDADEATLASIAFETTLSVQSVTLMEESAEVATLLSTEITSMAMKAEAPIPSLLASVVEETRAKTSANNASSTIPAFGKVMARVELNTTRAFELLDSLKTQATPETIAVIERRIEDIERSIQEAIALHETDDESARKLLVDTLQRIQKLIVFMTDISVSQNVDIEEIVPVILTADEKAVKKAEYQTELSAQVELVKSALTLETDVDVVEKANFALVQIETLLSELPADADFKLVEHTYQVAFEYANDAMRMLEVTGDQLIVPAETGSSTDPVASTTSEVIELETGSSSTSTVSTPEVDTL